MYINIYTFYVYTLYIHENLCDMAMGFIVLNIKIMFKVSLEYLSRNEGFFIFKYSL